MIKIGFGTGRGPISPLLARGRSDNPPTEKISVIHLAVILSALIAIAIAGAGLIGEMNHPM